MSKLYDVIIIGSGSAGMSAGIYAGRSKMKTLIIDKDKAGGQIKITAEVVNYPGVISASGSELSETMKKQAQNFGVEFLDADVNKVDLVSEIKKVSTSEGDFEAVSIIIASGAVPRTLGFIGEDEFKGRGIGYCATCDGEFFTGMDVFVVGAGFAAAEEAIFLTRFARKVTVIAREPEFTCSKTIADKVLAHPKIEVKFNTEILSVSGEKLLQKAEFINNENGEKWSYEVSGGDLTFGVFIFVGYIPQSQLYKGQIDIDQFGYIPTDENMQTKIDGVYAAGDIRPKTLRQLVTATADGAIAATTSEKYVEHTKERLGIKDEPTEQNNVVTESFFDDELKGQLVPIFEKFENDVIIHAVLDSSVEYNAELKSFLEDLGKITPKIKVNLHQKGDGFEDTIGATIFPSFALFNHKGEYTGIQYHAIPGGHEINSFVITLYNIAGPGQQTPQETLDVIASVDDKVNIKVAVTLSCTLCPDVVVGTQLMAAKNPNIVAEMIDVTKYPDFKAKYGIMSVPAIIINDDEITFGKKNIQEIVSLIKA